jgi:uncharacterized protein (TIGR03089 family)
VYQLTSPEQLFAQLLAAQPSRPFVSFHDDASGEWAELSAKSAANWVAKTHFLLLDSLGLGVGDTAFLDLPPHWISVPILLGCWSAGLSISPDPAEAAVAFVTPQSLAAAGGVADVFAINPAAAARGFGPDVPIDAEDYVVSVRPQPDAWGTVRFSASDDDPALDATTRRDAVAQGTERAAELGLSAGGRLLSVRPWTTPSDWIDAVIAPLTVGGSVVLVANADAERIERHATQERATAVLR